MTVLCLLHAVTNWSVNFFQPTYIISIKYVYKCISTQHYQWHAHKPVRLHSVLSIALVTNQISRSIKQYREPSGKRCMEVVACPRHVVVTVVDVWVRVVPRPEQLLYADNVKRYIQQHHGQTDCTNSTQTARVINFSGNLVLGENFWKFSLIVNITDNLRTSVDINETMHAMPISTINHENNVVVLLLVHYWRAEVPYILAYKSQNLRQNHAPKVRGATYPRVIKTFFQVPKYAISNVPVTNDQYLQLFIVSVSRNLRQNWALGSRQTRTINRRLAGVTLAQRLCPRSSVSPSELSACRLDAPHASRWSRFYGHLTTAVRPPRRFPPRLPPRFLLTLLLYSGPVEMAC